MSDLPFKVRCWDTLNEQHMLVENIYWVIFNVEIYRILCILNCFDILWEIILPAWYWKNWVEICCPLYSAAGFPSSWSRRRSTMLHRRIRRDRGLEPEVMAECRVLPRASLLTSGQTLRSGLMNCKRVCIPFYCRVWVFSLDVLTCKTIFLKRWTNEKSDM